MFIAVYPYKNTAQRITDKVLIYDTEDDTLEYVKFSEVKESGIEPRNIVYLGSGVPYLDSAPCWQSMYYNVRLFTRRGMHVLKSKTFQDITIGFGKNREIIVNGVSPYDVMNISSFCILYMFKFKAYTVMRLMVAYHEYYHITIVLDELGVVVCCYDKDLIYCTNRALAMQIDTLMEY